MICVLFELPLISRRSRALARRNKRSRNVAR